MSQRRADENSQLNASWQIINYDVGGADVFMSIAISQPFIYNFTQNLRCPSTNTDSPLLQFLER